MEQESRLGKRVDSLDFSVVCFHYSGLCGRRCEDLCGNVYPREATELCGFIAVPKYNKYPYNLFKGD